jgi:hypothetical protein
MKILILTAIALLVGCVTLPVAQPQSGGSADQQRLDTLSCKESARLGSGTPARIVGSALLGLTIIGAPLAIALDSAKQQELFTDCMHAKGYTLSPPGS